MIAAYEQLSRRGWKSRLLHVLAGLCLAAVMRPCRELPAAEPAWEVRQTVEVDGLSVSLSQPVLVARSHGYLWFPTLARLADGGLMALMSNYSDSHTTSSTAMVSWSQDGGLTWGEAVPGLYGDSSLGLASGDRLFLPYYLTPLGEGRMGAPYQVCRKGRQDLETVREGLTVGGWPRKDKSFAPELGLSGFVFNGQTVTLADGTYLATLYGYFQDTKRYSLVAAESPDGVKWTIRSTISDENCPLAEGGGEGPCEAALCRLKDERLLCVYRLASGVAFGQQTSKDEGKTWSAPQAMDGPYSVQPSLAVLGGGVVALSGGRPGVKLWLNKAGDAQDWSAIDLVAHHDACHPAEPIGDRQPGTSAYTEVISLDEGHVLCIYDRVPHGWHAIPDGSADTNSVWVVRIGIQPAAE